MCIAPDQQSPGCISLSDDTNYDEFEETEEGGLVHIDDELDDAFKCSETVMGSAGTGQGRDGNVD